MKHSLKRLSNPAINLQLKYVLFLLEIKNYLKTIIGVVPIFPDRNVQNEVQDVVRKFGGKFEFPAFPAAGQRRKPPENSERLSDGSGQTEHLKFSGLQSGNLKHDNL